MTSHGVAEENWLGMAMKSRDVTKGSRKGADDFGAALIEANNPDWRDLYETIQN